MDLGAVETRDPTFAELRAAVVLLREQNAELERAVEHAGYLADSVDHYLEERNKFDALEEVDVGDQDSLNDHFSALRDRVYEFRKRRAILSKVKGQSNER